MAKRNVEKNDNAKKKIGIVTYSKSNNYGARIQAVAVYRIFKQRGYDVEIIDVDYPKRYFKYVVGRMLNLSDSLSEWFLKYIITFKMMRFTRKNIEKTRHLITKSNKKMVDFINKRGYDAVVCGSDEIWSSRTSEIAPPSIYFLPKEIKAKRFGMSPSANGNHKFTQEEKKWMKETLSGYDLIGVRDTMTYNLVDSVAGHDNMKLIFDPTLALEFEDVPLPKVLDKKTKKKRVLFVMTRPDNHVPETIIQKLGTEEYEYYSVFSKFKGTKFLTISAEQFMCISKGFDLVYTNFFHGTIFAMKHQANVIALDTFAKYKNKKSKVRDLVERVGFPEIFFSTVEESFEYDKLIETSKELMKKKHSKDYSKELERIMKYMNEYIDEIEAKINC